MTDTVTERPSVAGPGPMVLRALIIAVVMGDFLSPFLISSLSIAIPVIDKDLALGTAEFGWSGAAILP